MFVQPTTIILGAGASCPYGFPLGSELVDRIATGLEDDFFRKNVLSSSVEIDLYRKMVEAINLAHPISIDYFLEKRCEFADIGKIAIAYNIYMCQQAHVLRERRRKGIWYNKLLDVLGSTVDHLKRNSLSIITFNYDVSLEYFLLVAVAARFNLDDQQAAEVVSAIPIHHVYGSLAGVGPLSGEIRDQYQFRSDPLCVRNMAKSIKVIGESSPIDPLLPTLVKNSKYVFTLGFGFHEENSVRLGLHLRGGAVFGTRHGMTDAEVERLKSRLVPTFSDCHSDLVDVYGFLRNDETYLIASAGYV